MKKIGGLLSGCIAVMAAVAIPAAAATVTVTPGGLTTSNSVNTLVQNSSDAFAVTFESGSLGWFADGAVNFTASGHDGSTGIFQGTVEGFHRAPAGDTRNYLSVGPDQTLAITLGRGATVRSFSFLWGSIDTYNSIALYTADGALQTYTGSDILALAPTMGQCFGLAGCTATVSFTADGNGSGFDRIVLSSTSPAFESDNYLFTLDPVADPAPEPASLASLAIGVAVVFFRVARRRSVA